MRFARSFRQRPRARPRAPVFDCRSEPARSTRLSFPTRIFDFPSGPPFSLAVSIVMRNTAWLRLLVKLYSVERTCETKEGRGGTLNLAGLFFSYNLIAL